MGILQTATGNGSYAFLYSGGVITAIGGVGTNATGINDAGQVVGSFSPATGGVHSFLYSGGVLNDLGTLGGNTFAGGSTKLPLTFRVILMTLSFAQT